MARKRLNEDGSVATHELGSAGDRIVTVPNLITAVRLACIPLFLYLLLGQDRQVAAAGLLAVLGTTDWIDGYIARRFHQASNLGKQLDPIADRALMFFAIGGIVIDGSAPTWFAAVSLGREFVMSAWVIGITAAGAERMDVTWYGKAGTFGQMMAFPLFLLAAGSTGTTHDVAWFLAWVCGIPGLCFSFIAFFQYFPRGLAALRAGRAPTA